MPKDFAICMVEGDDISEAKKRIGDNVTIAGGMPIAMLKYNTKGECIDYAKKLLDECAPGGGYIFTTDRHFITGADVNTENVIAVHDFVHNYK
jgi:uroporphyrinogen-III decarboxylase